MKTLQDSIKCIHEFWEIISDTVQATHHSQYADVYLECTMRCKKCHTTATATRTELNNESSSDIVS